MAPHDTRDTVIDFVNYWSEKTGIPGIKFISWLGIIPDKFYDWKRRYGKVNEHNSWIPRDSWLEAWGKESIINFCYKHPGEEGYRRLTFMMLDADIIAVSPSSVYRVLKSADLLNKWNRKSSSKGSGFKEPSVPHEHRHTDITYPEYMWNILLFLQRSGWLQPVYYSLGNKGIDDRS